MSYAEVQEVELKRLKGRADLVISGLLPLNHIQKFQLQSQLNEAGLEDLAKKVAQA